jgi:UDP-N-acetylmuramoyl-L-alanyl-D-glutamate--2,6-diaminopimelate ligase
MPEHTLEEFADSCGELLIAQHGTPTLRITGVTQDSRQIGPGMLFVAIQGAQQDGRRFIPDALARGAAAVVLSGEQIPDCPCLQVRNDYHAFGRLAEFAAGYPARDLCLIGVTGTNGKTTTAFLIHHLLRAAGHKAALLSTVRYDTGDQVHVAERTTPTPSDFQKLLCEARDSGCGYVVLEVSSHALAQRRPGTARFAAAVFTNLSGDHLDYHGEMESYFAAKRLLFTNYLDGPAIINTADPWGERLACELHRPIAPLVEFARFTAQGTEACIRIGHVVYELRTPQLGAYNLDNLRCAIAVLHGLGLPVDPEAVANFAGVPGRLERVGQGDPTVLVDYAHTDAALGKALSALRALNPRQLWVVFGAGGDRDRSKRARMGAVADELADRVILTSDNPRSEDPAAILAEIAAAVQSPQIIADRAEAIAYAIGKAEAGDIVLIAGKGHESYQEIQGERFPFDDVEVCRACLDKRGEVEAWTGFEPV